MAVAYSYIRFSSKAQADGDSLRRQLTRTKEWCRQNNVELSDKNFQDLGISAFKEKTRPSLDDLFEAIQTGSIQPDDYIILENLDRLSRQGIDHTQEMLRQILRSGVNVVDLTNGLELNRNSLNDLVSVIRIAIAADLAYQESKKKSERVLAAKAQQRKLAREGKVINKRLPFWLGKSEDNTQYVFNERVQAVREIVELRKKGVGFHKIAMHLNERYPPLESKFWSDVTIRETVKHRSLYGSMVDKDGEIENALPPVIDFTEWLAIQPQATSSAGGYTKHNHLSRLVKCDVCGGAMSKKIQKSKTKTKTHEYNTWKCVNVVSGGCTNKAVIRDLDLDVIDSLNHLKINVGKSGSKLNKLNQKIDKKNARLQELEQALLEDDAPITPLTNAIKKTKVELNELRSERDLLSVSTDSKLLHELSHKPVEFNVELRKLVRKIVVIPVHGNMWRVKIHQHNGHVVSMVKSRLSQRKPWTRFFSKTETIKNM